MPPESNFPIHNLSSEKSKGSLMPAILLGFLTFIVTGAVFLVAALIGRLFGINLAGMALFGAWGGYVKTQFALIALFLLLGDLVTAWISWLINRSKKFATITFISALVLQAAGLGLVLGIVPKASQEVMNAGIAQEKSYEQYASVGKASFELKEPFSESRGINGKLVEVSMFKKLELIVPVEVSQAGTYKVYAQYSDNEIGSTPMKDTTQTLYAGVNDVRIEFTADESRERGYLSPGSTKGIAQIQLYYLAQIAGSGSVVNKFVERKEVQFGL